MIETLTPGSSLHFPRRIPRQESNIRNTAELFWNKSFSKKINIHKSQMSSHFSSLNLRNVTGRRYILSLVTVTQHFLLLYLLRQEIRTTFTVLSLTVPTIPSGLIIEQCKIRRRDILLCNIKIRSWVDGSNTSLWYFQPSGLSVIQTQLSTVAGRDLVRDSQTSEE